MPVHQEKGEIQMNNRKENGKMRGFGKGIMLFFMTMLLSLGVPSVFQDAGMSQVKAASFEQCSRTAKTGGYYIWSDGNAIRISESASGEGEVLVNADNGYRVGYSIISDGSVLYYYLNKNSVAASYIYQYDIAEKTSRSIGKVDNLRSIKAYYNQSLYLVCDAKNPSVWDAFWDTYRFNIKTSKLTRIGKELTIAEAKGKYLVLRQNPENEAANHIYSYNCATRKKTLITKKGVNTQIIGDKLYYSVRKGNGCRIYTCKLNGKGKKAISKDIGCSSVGKITKKYAYFGKYSGSTYKYYQYSFQTKKTKTITKIKYESIMGW